MKFTSQAALVALIASVEARHGHHHARHHEARSVDTNDTVLVKKSGQCQFPSDAGLVSITPHQQNAGWAMSPNQRCKPGNYCPYACPPGQVSMQWDPKATSYSYPMSMNGGLYCDDDGNIHKPFPNKPYCEDGTGGLKAKDKTGKSVSFCQTVLPGNEAMIIPTLVKELATLAVPGMSYWCETSAQYYINTPGVSAEEGCVWGTSAKAVGNWSPYTAGANTNGDGVTFLKIGWNPIYLEPTTPFRNEKPEFGIEIECEGGECQGLPCKIDPSVNGVNEMHAPNSFTGAGGALGCVVTAPKGVTAHIVVFEPNGSGGEASQTVSVSTSSATPTSSSSTSTSTPTPSSTSTETPTSSSIPTSTSTPTPTPSSISTSTPTPTSTRTPSSTATPSSTVTPSSSSKVRASTRLAKSSPSASYTYLPHVFAPTGSAEISGSGSNSGSSSAPTGSASASPSTGINGATSATFSLASLALGAVAALMINF
ncbi:hypothetical protein N7492_007097 [Penicillium capsulatum]|uniref:SUN domain-containing protein n=1 Tax=Penicillium capsulatum TaxID=69766 RepID=A0A9W9LKZ0_9EURO|nr:hypothetical protein N7492_007097 [Penicillium capsulatum]KAJ6116933.1 hypothetical protein N7512_006658 [Penicillium capsulatum]